MTISFSGLGSGLDINSWITQLVAVKKSSLVSPLQDKLNTLQSKNTALTSLKSKFSTLESALKTFTKTIYDSSNDMWTNASVSSSNDAYATASTSGYVASGSVKLEIEQIATATKAQSTASLGQITAENASDVNFESLANSQAKAGNFTMFLDNKEYNVNIENGWSLQRVMDEINNVSGGKIQATIEDGKFSINAYKKVTEDDVEKWVVDTDAKLSLGRSNDTSNIVSALKLTTPKGDYGFESAYPLSRVNAKVAMASPESGIDGVEFTNEEGKNAKITINGIDFEIDETTTLNNLISKINSNSDVNVKASYDSLTNRFTLTSTQTGKSNISLSEEGTNLLNKLGLTQYVYDEDNNIKDEILAGGSQILGENAIAYINGNKIISTSNTITGETSGVSNLSIVLKKTTDTEDVNSVTLDIEPDNTAVKNALKSFVNAYNDVVTTTKKMISSDGALGRDSSLNSILTNLRGITSKLSNNAGDFTMLAQIGIASSKDDVSKLEIDEKKLDKVLKENFDSVKYLLSDGYTSKADTGLFDGLFNTISNVLDTKTGYFTTKTGSIDSQISSLNSRIDRANTLLSSYEARITKEFNLMDSTISSLNSQLSTFQSYIGF